MDSMPSHLLPRDVLLPSQHVDKSIQYYSQSDRLEILAQLPVHLINDRCRWVGLLILPDRLFACFFRCCRLFRFSILAYLRISLSSSIDPVGSAGLLNWQSLFHRPVIDHNTPFPEPLATCLPTWPPKPTTFPYSYKLP